MDPLRSPYIPARWDLSDLNSVERGQLTSILSADEKSDQRQNLWLWSKDLLAGDQAPLGLEILSNLAKGQDTIAEQSVRLRNAFLGEGVSVDRLEFHSQDFLKNLADPALLVGMVGGALTYRTLNRAGLHLWSDARKSTWLRCQGGKLAAASLGTAGEVPVFLGTEKAIRHISGRPQDWATHTLWEESQSLALQLFFLKSIQGLSLFGFYRAHGLNSELGSMVRMQGLSGATQKVLPYAASVGGIYIGAHAENWRQGRAAPNSGVALLDAMVFGAQYGLAGHLSQAILRAPLSSTQASQSMLQSTSSELNGDLSWISGHILWTPEGIPFRWGAPKNEPFESKFYSSALKPGVLSTSGSPHLPRNQEKFYQNLSQVSRLQVDDLRLQKIAEKIFDTRVPLTEEYQKLILGAEYHPAPSVTRFHSTETLSSADILERGVSVVHRAFQLDSHRHVYGTAFDALVQHIVLEALPRGQPSLFGDFFQLLAFNPQMRHLEKFMEDYGLSQAFKMPPLERRPQLTEDHPWSKHLDNLIFIGEERRILSQYLATFHDGAQVPHWVRPENNHLLMADGSKIPITPELAFAAIKKTNDYWVKREAGAEVLGFLEEALHRAERSAIPWFYLDRLIKVMLTDRPTSWNTMQPRLLEIAYSDGAIYPKIQATLKSTKNRDAAMEEIDGSVFTAYLHDPGITRRLLEMYPKMKGLLHAASAQQRSKTFESFSYKRLSQAEFNIDREVVLDLLGFSKTPEAQGALADIRAGLVDFELVPQKVMRQYLKEYNGQTGLFLPPELRQDGIRDRPLILLSKNHPTAKTPFELWHNSKDYPLWLMHEYSHFRNDYSAREGFMLMRSPERQMIGEFRAFLEETLLALEFGDTQKWLLGDVSPYGWAGSMRGFIERVYWGAPRKLWVTPDEVQSVLE